MSHEMDYKPIPLFQYKGDVGIFNGSFYSEAQKEFRQKNSNMLHAGEPMVMGAALVANISERTMKVLEETNKEGGDSQVTLNWRNIKDAIKQKKIDHPIHFFESNNNFLIFDTSSNKYSVVKYENVPSSILQQTAIFSTKDIFERYHLLASAQGRWKRALEKTKVIETSADDMSALLENVKETMLPLMAHHKMLQKGNEKNTSYTELMRKLVEDKEACKKVFGFSCEYKTALPPKADAASAEPKKILKKVEVELTSSSSDEGSNEESGEESGEESDKESSDAESEGAEIDTEEQHDTVEAEGEEGSAAAKSLSVLLMASAKDTEDKDDVDWKQNAKLPKETVSKKRKPEEVKKDGKEKRAKPTHSQPRMTPEAAAHSTCDQMSLKHCMSLIAGYLEPNQIMLAKTDEEREYLRREQECKFRSILVSFSPWKYVSKTEKQKEKTSEMLRSLDQSSIYADIKDVYESQDEHEMLVVESGKTGNVFKELAAPCTQMDSNIVVMLLFEKLYELQQKHTGQFIKQITEKIDVWYQTIQNGLLSEKPGMASVYRGTVYAMGSEQKRADLTSYGFENTYDSAISMSVAQSVIAFVMEHFRPSYQGTNRVAYKWMQQYGGDEISHYNEMPTLQTQGFHDRATRLLK